MKFAEESGQGFYIDDPSVNEVYADVVEGVGYNGLCFSVLLSVRRSYQDKDGDKAERRTAARLVLPAPAMQELINQVQAHSEMACRRFDGRLVKLTTSFPRMQLG